MSRAVYPSSWVSFTFVFCTNPPGFQIRVFPSSVWRKPGIEYVYMHRISYTTMYYPASQIILFCKENYRMGNWVRRGSWNWQSLGTDLRNRVKKGEEYVGSWKNDSTNYGHWHHDVIWSGKPECHPYDGPPMMMQWAWHCPKRWT